MSTDRVILESVDSTMSEASRRAKALSNPTWIVAHHQTNPRGRRGRPWKQLEGNFAATLVLQAEPRTAAFRSFVAALALRETLLTFGVDGLSLKWPNDVLVRGGKAAGILLEMLDTSTLSIGIGINLAAAPDTDEVESDATRPVALGLDHSASEVLDYLAPSFEYWDRRLTEEGFRPIREAWLAHAARVGEPIRARTVTEEHHGTFETIDNDGCLVLSTAKGRLTIPAADVYF